MKLVIPYLYEIYLFSGAVLKLNSSGQEIVANNEKFYHFHQSS